MLPCLRQCHASLPFNRIPILNKRFISPSSVCSHRFFTSKYELVKPRIDVDRLLANREVTLENAVKRGYTHLNESVLNEIQSLSDHIVVKKRLVQQLRESRRSSAFANAVTKTSTSTTTTPSVDSDSLGNVSKKQTEDSEQPNHLSANVVAIGKQLRQQLLQAEEELESLESRLLRLALRFPNDTHPSVVAGGEEDSPVIKVVCNRPITTTSSSPSSSPKPSPSSSFPLRDHLSLCQQNLWVDFERPAELTGQKFASFKNECALLELALVQWTMHEILTNFSGFTPVLTPDVIKQHVAERCGFQARGPHSQMYEVFSGGLTSEGTASSVSKTSKSSSSSTSSSPSSDPTDTAMAPLCLIGTAEIPLTAIHLNEVLAEEQLPIKYLGLSHCFRAEVGGMGLKHKGLYRLHQFTKLEMVALTHPSQSEKQHAEFVAIEEHLLNKLNLPYRVLDMASGDLGAVAYRKFDIEAWMPSHDNYREVTSASNCTDYQSRRLNIRFRSKTASPGGKQPLYYVHTLNGTAIAVPRIILAILENYQAFDGKVEVPHVLRPYLGGVEVIPSQKLIQIRR